jgi:Na+/citrate or Na+/malate symporter
MSNLINFMLILVCGIFTTTLTTWIIGLITGKDSGGMLVMVLPIMFGLFVSLAIAYKIFKPKR